MKPLSQQFKHDGFNFSIISKTGRICLLSKQNADYPQGRISYEVVRLRLYPDKVIKGILCPAHEFLPATSTWGIAGWSFLDLASAQDKFNMLSIVQERA